MSKLTSPSLGSFELEGDAYTLTWHTTFTLDGDRDNVLALCPKHLGLIDKDAEWFEAWKAGLAIWSDDDEDEDEEEEYDVLDVPGLPYVVFPFF